MQTKREYLASLGLAIAGSRGKFSNAGKEALVKAYAEGMSFSDDNKPVKPVKPTGEATAKPTAKPDPRVTDYLFPSDFRFPEDEYKAVEVGGKRVFSMRECCNLCRVSLTNHFCDAPTVLGVPVSIVTK